MTRKAPPANLTNIDIRGDAANELTPREKRFCEEYQCDLNATQAARRAGYSRRTARTIASVVMQKPHVAARIAKLIAERCARTNITADRVIQELAVIAFSDPRDLTANDSGQMRLSAGAPSSAARAVASIKRTRASDEEGVVAAEVEFTLWNKVVALRQLAPLVGLVTERGELTGEDGAPIESIVRIVRDGSPAASGGNALQQQFLPIERYK